MPLPTAEFSPFTMVKLAPSSRFKPGSIWRRQSQPCRATTSPMVRIFTCTPFLSDAGSGVIAEILYYIPGVITRIGLKFNTFATFEYSGAYRVLPVVYSFDKLCGRLRGNAGSLPIIWLRFIPPFNNKLPLHTQGEPIGLFCFLKRGEHAVCVKSYIVVWIVLKVRYCEFAQVLVAGEGTVGGDLQITPGEVHRIRGVRAL